MKGISIEERANQLAHYIIDSKDTVRGAAKKFRRFKKYSTHRCNTPERFENWTSIEIKKVFLAEKNPVVKLGLIIK